MADAYVDSPLRGGSFSTFTSMTAQAQRGGTLGDVRGDGAGTCPGSPVSEVVHLVDDRSFI